MQEEGPLDNNNKRHIPHTRPELTRANLSSCQLYRGKTSMYYDRYQGAAPNLFSSSAKYNANGGKFPLDWGSSMKGRKDVFCILYYPIIVYIIQKSDWVQVLRSQ